MNPRRLVLVAVVVAVEYRNRADTGLGGAGHRDLLVAISATRAALAQLLLEPHQFTLDEGHRLLELASSGQPRREAVSG